MQPHKGLSSRDSFTVCQPADIFSHIRSPKQPLQKDLPIHIDTLESERVAISRLMLEKPILRPIYFLGKSCKVVIVFFLFPVHFFLFRAPKWLFLKMGPIVFTASSKITLKCKEYAHKLIESVITRLKVLTRLQESLKAFGPILNSFFKEMANFLAYFLTPFKKAEEQIKKGYLKFKQKMAKTIESTSFLFNKLSAIAKRAVDLAKKSESLRKSSFLPLKASLTAMGETIKEKWNPLSKAVVTHLKKWQKRAADLNFKVSQKKLLIKNRISESVTALKEIVKEKAVDLKEIISPKIETALSLFQKTGQLLNPPFVIASDFLKKTVDRGHLFFSRQTKVQQFVKTYGNYFKKVFNKESALAPFFRSFKRLSQDVSAASKNLGKKIVSFYREEKEKIKERIKRFLLKVLQSFSFLFKIFIYYLFKILNKSRHFFILFFKWCRIMAKFVYYLGQEILLEIQTI